MTSLCDGRPMQIMVDGRVLRYVGGLLTGEPQYEEVSAR